MCPATVGASTAAEMWIAGAAIAASTAMAAYSANQQEIALEDAAKLKGKQQNEAAQLQTNDRLKEARERRAQARAASAESGVSGNSTNAILHDILMQSGRDVTRIEKNRINGVLSTQQQVRGRSSEINGQLIAGVASSAQQAGSLYGSYSDAKKPLTIQ